ncbi:hypothetical protein DYB32_010254 [Aphanomyces invadans]|uniref:PDZ domain-containing protein n=1 Tax=Aphanomyces invadans TaxID=157072 RepID=A0A418AG03_9STRA|nr:hypothetical protein DYB32_010254 [Aphanomyces invadans]
MIHVHVNLHVKNQPSTTDDVDNYVIQWRGGDLGLALVSEPVCVSRVTGKGSPKGLEHARPGDVLLSINGVATKHLTKDAVTHILLHCALPATLHFARPDYDDFWTYPRRTSMPSLSPFAHGDAPPRPRRLSFTPPHGYDASMTPTSPRNSNGPVKSLLAPKPATERIASSRGPRHSALF